MRRRVVLPSIRAKERYAITTTDCERDVAEESPACELLAQIGRDDDRHGLER